MQAVPVVLSDQIPQTGQVGLRFQIEFAGSVFVVAVVFGVVVVVAVVVAVVAVVPVVVVVAGVVVVVALVVYRSRYQVFHLFQYQSIYPLLLMALKSKVSCFSDLNRCYNVSRILFKVAKNSYVKSTKV